MLRRLSQHVVTRASDLYLRLPEAGSGGDTLSRVPHLRAGAAAAQRRARRATPLVAAYPTGDVPTLDFPYVVLPGATQARGVGGHRVPVPLLAPAARRALQQAGFRDPDGSPPPASVGPGPRHRPAGCGWTRCRRYAMPAEDNLVQVLSRWTGVHLSARILGVIDVSGSMNERDRRADPARAADAGRAAGRSACCWTPPRSASGCSPPGWTATATTRCWCRPARWRSSGAGSTQALGAVRAKPDGDTGLYDTTLAAYQEARRNWMPGRINLVLIATDGRNDDDQSISRAQLHRRAGQAGRPAPAAADHVHVGIGPGVDLGELNEIAKVVDGRVYIAAQPSDIRPIFFSALSEFGCQPPSCRK